MWPTHFPNKLFTRGSLEPGSGCPFVFYSPKATCRPRNRKLNTAFEKALRSLHVIDRKTIPSERSSREKSLRSGRPGVRDATEIADIVVKQLNLTYTETLKVGGLVCKLILGHEAPHLPPRRQQPTTGRKSTFCTIALWCVIRDAVN